MDAETHIRKRFAELSALAEQALEREDFESMWIHDLLATELQNLCERLASNANGKSRTDPLCASCPLCVALVCPRRTA